MLSQTIRNNLSTFEIGVRSAFPKLTVWDYTVCMLLLTSSLYLCFVSKNNLPKFDQELLGL